MDLFSVVHDEKAKTVTIRIGRVPAPRGPVDWSASTKERADKLASVLLGDPGRMLVRGTGDGREYVTEHREPEGWSPVPAR